MNEFNPYSAPATQPPHSDSMPHPQLPIVFVPSLAAYLTAIPSGLLMLLITFFCIFQSFIASRWEATLFAILIAIFAGVIALGCFGIFWIKVSVTEDAILKQDYAPRLISFEDIKAWQGNSAPNSIAIALEDGKLLHLHNWAMTRKNCKIMSEILRLKVGPPN